MLILICPERTFCLSALATAKLAVPWANLEKHEPRDHKIEALSTHFWPAAVSKVMLSIRIPPGLCSNNIFLYVCAVRISWKTWSQLPRVYHFFCSARWMTELSVTWPCLRGICFFQFFAAAILWDTAVFGAHSPHMSVETARPDAGVPPTITKT